MTVILNSMKRILLPRSLILETAFAADAYNGKIYFIETENPAEFMLVPASCEEYVKDKNILYVVNCDYKSRIFLSNFLKEQKIRRRVEKVEIFVKNKYLYLRV